MPQPAAGLLLLDLLLGQLLLLLGPELHALARDAAIVLGAAVHGTADGAGAERGGVKAAVDGRGGLAGAAILEAVERGSGRAAVGDAAVVDVPLLRGEGADELFVVGDHDDAATEVADGDG